MFFNSTRHLNILTLQIKSTKLYSHTHTHAKFAQKHTKSPFLKITVLLAVQYFLFEVMTIFTQRSFPYP